MFVHAVLDTVAIIKHATVAYTHTSALLDLCRLKWHAVAQNFASFALSVSKSDLHPFTGQYVYQLVVV